MAEFTLSFRMDNAAFSDDPGAEAARILRQIAATVANGGDGWTFGEANMRPIRDVNGNRIGEWTADLEDLADDDE